MIKNIRRSIYSACQLFLCCGVLAWSTTAHSSVAPVVSTLSAITEGSVTPVRLAADQSGNIYVTDPRGGGVLKYNSAGNLLQRISTTSKNVLGIALAKSGDILVSQGTVVAVYSSAGIFKSSFGTFGTANGIAVNDAGAVFVVDSKNNNVQMFNVDYTLNSTFGTTGSATGQFKQPTGITFEKLSKQLAVVDTHNGRVQFFTSAGVYQKTVGSFGSGPLKFTSPQAITFEYSPDGTVLSRMYVVDSFQANIQVIDAASSGFLRYIGSYGTRGGQLVTPGDILLDPFNRLIIPNGTGTLVVFGVDGASSAVSSNSPAVTFPAPSTGSNPPALTLNTINLVTKTSPVTISGTVSTGSAVSVNGTAATVDANGNWALPVLLTQQGLNNFVIIASKGGSSSSISAYLTLDTSVPVVATSSLPQNGSTTSSPIQTISGSVSDTTATNVTVTVNGVPQIVPVNNGLFNTAIVLGLGSNSVTVTATDAAGNVSVSSSSSVTYNPLSPAVTVLTPGGAVSGSASYTVTGTAPSGSQVSVNGILATVTGTLWTTSIPLLPGINPIIITASVAGSPVSTLSSSVTYAPGQPSLAVTSPAVDSATAKSSVVISGLADNGTSITALLNGPNGINGVAVPVTVASDGSFAAVLPLFATSGTYTVEITAIDANGIISSTTRSLVYDPAPPAFTVVDATPAAIKVSSSNGVIVARDKNGIVSAPTNGTSALDLSNATYDAATLNIQAITATGISSRNGDINGDGKVDIEDALLALKISSGSAPAPTFIQLLRGDVGPLVNHTPVPDGRIRLDDAILILQKSVGIDW
jgi:uncharacterized protein YfaP (DUF2135 family)